MDKTELDLTNSKLTLQGTKEDHDKLSNLIIQKKNDLKTDQSDRKEVYKVRSDFNIGDQAKYSNIVGIKEKEKQGHANAVFNYAGKTIQKIAQKMSNNPPNIDFPIDALYSPEDPDYDIEEKRSQAVENFVDSVFKKNKFWKRGYRRANFNQAKLGDFALKVYPINLGDEQKPVWELRIVNQEKMENLMVGWRGDDSKEFDFVLCDNLISIQSIENDWGIKVPVEAIENGKDDTSKNSSHNNNNQWGTRNVGGISRKIIPSGANTIPSVHVIEYDDENVYAMQINDQIVQYIVKDGKTLPKIKFWVLGENIPNTGSHWSIADIDYLIDANIELNEASNDERDYVRVGANQKYVAYNMSDFDPESVKTGSGGVIFVDDPNGNARFDALSTNVNTYPVDTYLTRVKKHIHDLGVPEVDFGSSNNSSGRSKALDYQSLVDLMTFKQDSWELVLTELTEKIQILGYFLYKKDFFTDAKTGALSIRFPEYDWSDIVPITQSDKIVNVLNKFQMGLPFKLVFKELGYRDPDAVVNQIKKEANDPILMEFRAKLFQLTPGIMQAQSMSPAAQMNAEDAAMGSANPNVPGAVLTSDQNTGSQPMSARGGTQSSSTATGQIATQRQNLQAQGR